MSFGSFVFDNFTWERDGPEYSNYNGKLIPSRIPLSAMISGKGQKCLHALLYSQICHSGPIIGGPFPPGDDAPRAVSKNYFYEVCPNRTIIDSGEVNADIRFDDSVGALQIVNKWVEKLNSIKDPCVEISQKSYQLFEIWYFYSLYSLTCHAATDPKTGCLAPRESSISGLRYPNHQS